MATMDFMKVSKDITKKLGKTEKKKYGIYFTPPSLVKHTIDILNALGSLKDHHTILEPSCGTGEYIHGLHSFNPNMTIRGIELNDTVYNAVKGEFKNNPQITIEQADYIDIPETDKYDLIIGNPPFNVIKKTAYESKYAEYLTGRPNIFNLFILKSLSIVNKGGIISFVLPATFLNSIYYNKTRDYIYNTFKIRYIDRCDCKFIDTTQPTILLIIQQSDRAFKQNNNRYTIKTKNDITVFNSILNTRRLKQLMRGSTTIQELGFSVKVGNLVWNQQKQALVNDSSKARLIYSSDVKDKRIRISDFSGKEKENYIDPTKLTTPKTPYKESMLLINRGYGKGTYKFEYAFIDGSYPYFVENHVLCVIPNKVMEQEEREKKYGIIMKSLENSLTTEFTSIFCANDAMTTTELANVLPIWVT